MDDRDSAPGTKKKERDGFVVNKNEDDPFWPRKARRVVSRLLKEKTVLAADLVADLTHAANRLAWLENRDIVAYNPETKSWYLKAWVYTHTFVENHKDGLFGLADAGLLRAEKLLTYAQKRRTVSCGKTYSGMGRKKGYASLL